MNKSLLIVLVALIACFALCAARTPRRASVESDLKLGKVLGKIGKGALKVGKAYVGQKYGINLADVEEAEADKKIDFDEVFNWIGKGKQIYDLFKKDSEEEEVEADLKLGKIFSSIGKGALKVGKAYVGQKYGIQLSDEELADKKVTIDDIFEWIGKGKKIHDILKGSDAEEEADKLNLDEIFGYVAKGKQIFDIFKSFKKQAPAAETESDIKIGKLLGKIGKGALKVGKAYVGQKYGINLSDEELASDLKLGKALKSIGKGALKVGKAYVGQKYGIQLSDSDKKINLDEIFGWVSKGKQIYDIFKSFKKQPAVEAGAEEESDSMNGGSTAASFARAQVGKGYSQAARLGPNSFDCSGLVKTAWARAGVTVPNTTSGYPGGLRRVNDLQVGDILWRSGHVGIYVGNNQVVNAENPRSGVQIRDLDWYKRYMGVSAIYRP